MAHAFVLVDALNGREQDVFEAVSKVENVIAKRLLQPRVGAADMIVLMHGKDIDEIEKLVAGRLRGIGGVQGVQRMMPHHTVLGQLPKIMREMEMEAEARKSP